ALHSRLVGHARRLGQVIEQRLLLRFLGGGAASGLRRLLGLGERKLLLQILCGGQHIERCRHGSLRCVALHPVRAWSNFARPGDSALISIKNPAIGAPRHRIANPYLYASERNSRFCDRSKQCPCPGLWIGRGISDIGVIQWRRHPASCRPTIRGISARSPRPWSTCAMLRSAASCSGTSCASAAISTASTC